MYGDCSFLQEFEKSSVFPLTVCKKILIPSFFAEDSRSPFHEGGNQKSEREMAVVVKKEGENQLKTTVHFTSFEKHVPHSPERYSGRRNNVISCSWFYFHA